jgi:hypothetical protein
LHIAHLRHRASDFTAQVGALCDINVKISETMLNYQRAAWLSANYIAIFYGIDWREKHLQETFAECF